MKNIEDYTINELKDMIENHGNSYSVEELNQIKKQYNTLLELTSDSQRVQYSKKDLLRALSQHGLCERTTLTPEQVARYKGKTNVYVEHNKYLCQLDETTNTRLLLGIYNCLNFMRNVVIFSAIASVISVIIAIISSFS